MKLGVTMFPTDYAIGPLELAPAVEERGFDCLLYPEHTHIPTSRETPYPGGGDLPEEYWHTEDPFVALSAAAVVTTTLKLGTGVCLVVERDPIVTAKAVASLDRLSGGRFLFGIGAGWNREEMANHGTDPRTRMELLADRVNAMREIWTKDEAEYHGRFVDFDPIWCWPKPVQQPHPPVLVGGTGPGVLERVLEFGDEWMPNRVRNVDELAPRVAELQRLAAERGRGPVPVTVYSARPEPEFLDRCAEIGVHRCTLTLTPGPADDVLAQLDGLAKLLDRVG